MAVSQMNFRFNVPNISKLDKIYTPEINVQGIPWKVEISKNEGKGYKSLEISLDCENSDKSLNWVNGVQASISLLSFNQNAEAYKLSLEPSVSHPEHCKNGFYSFIKWDDLFNKEKCYVKNDAINLDINIVVVDPDDNSHSRLLFKRIYKSCCENCRSTFEIKIENLSRLVAVKTPKFDNEKLPWTLSFFKHSSGQLTVHLETDGKELNKRDLLIQIVSSVEQKDKITFIRPSNNSHDINMIAWDDLFKPENGFVGNDSIKIHVECAVDGIHIDNETIKKSTPETKRAAKPMECSICLDEIQEKDISSIRCGHLFCTECITDHLESSDVCPLCKESAKVGDLRRTHLPGPNKQRYCSRIPRKSIVYID